MTFDPSHRIDKINAWVAASAKERERGEAIKSEAESKATEHFQKADDRWLSACKEAADLRAAAKEANAKWRPIAAKIKGLDGKPLAKRSVEIMCKLGGTPDPEKAVARHRSQDQERKRKQREAQDKNGPAPPGDHAPHSGGSKGRGSATACVTSDPEHDFEDGDPPEKIWKDQFEYRAKEGKRMARESLEELPEGLKVTKAMVEAARDVAQAWLRLNEKLAQRRS